MVDLWYQRGIPDPAPSWGTHVTTSNPKFLLHTTEGPLGAYTPDPRRGPGRTYFGNTGTWPNYTLARLGRVGPWRIFNHIPANRSSMSLRNQPGGVETNRDNVSQIEIATRAVDIGSLPGEALDELAKLLAWEHKERGVPLVTGVRWVAFPASAGGGASQRLSGSAWLAYSGVLGHQHVPENDHGDPGAFPIEKLLSRALDIVQGDDVTEQDKIDIANKVTDKVLTELRARVFAVEPEIRQPNEGAVIGSTYNKVGDVQATLTGVKSTLAGLQSTLAGVQSTVTDEQPMLTGVQSILTDVNGRIDFLYDQLSTLAAASGIVLPLPPWRIPDAPQ
jgi:hypothetical protein